MNTLVFKRFLLSLSFIFISIGQPLMANTNHATAESQNQTEQVKNEKHNKKIHQEHHIDVSPLLFIIFALLIGAGARSFLSKIGLPFTVVLLLIGLVMGSFGRQDLFGDWVIGGINIDLTVIDSSINWAAHINPHLILYVFLPILIFEAAFAMDVHVFKKVLVNSTILAVPGILIAIFLTAGLLWGVIYYGLGLTDWSWQITLLFGAVISATDPVAVVAILKDLGASKKLSTLIEGESMLNDGTAIVIFMVIFLGITGDGLAYSPILEFFRVSFGGILIGFLIGKTSLFWIKHVFKDMLVEATLIIVSAYFVFFICENIFSVSGVLGLVTLGVMMAGPGRTKITPQVQHFIHEFWEFTAFAANTLIFLIVGVVIAERTNFTMNDFWMLLVVYVIIHLARIVVITILYPVMKKIGYGITITDSKVLWWGALRGAIGLSLALIVESSPYINQTVREQFLFLIAGTVTLTLLINATTMKTVANKLGLTKVSPEKEYALQQAEFFVDTSTDKAIKRLKEDRFYKRVNFNEVEKYTAFDLPDCQVDLNKSKQEFELRRRVLEKEKSSYWHQFEEGTLGGQAYNMLVNEVNEILDANGEIALSDRKDLEELLYTRTKMKTAKFAFLFKRSYIKKLYTSFDMAMAFYYAQVECEKMVSSSERSAETQEIKILEEVEFEIEENKIQALTYLRNFKKEFPEIYKDISTKKAMLIVLNQEKRTINRLFRQGRITSNEKEKMTGMVDDKINNIFN
jgi:NhaP-type Na+/H+ or K+/H+ antiporter